MTLISAVVPCFNEQESLPVFVEEFRRMTQDLRAHHPDVNIELLFVDDGSTDDTLIALKGLAAHNNGGSGGQPEIKWLSFSRNFGKEAAVYAGLSYAKGDFVAILDADLQDPPSLLPEMYEVLLAEEYDNVATRRVTREGEPPVRSFFAKLFYRIMGRISNADIVEGARDFRLMKRRMVDAIVDMGEYNRFLKGICSWVGFKTKWLSYTNIERTAGKTKWSFWSLCVYAIDGIVAFSTVPLSVASIVGILLCFIAFVAVIFVVARAALFGDAVAGWPSMMAIMLFIGGLQLLCLGIIGQYLAKTYLETKRRPLFILKEASFDTANV